MIPLEVERRAWEPDLGGERFAWAPEPSPAARLIEPGHALVHDGEIVLVHAEPPLSIRAPRAFLGERLARVRWDGRGPTLNEFRLSGFNNMHRTFGFSAPQVLRRRYGCAPCGFDRENGDVSTALAEVARGLDDLFGETAPAAADAHRALIADSIRSDWRFGGAPWTSGIINHAAALPYHRDSGNLVGSWSAMLVSRRHLDGGLLHVPEFDVWLECADGACVLFDGQGAWHGVTPLHPQRVGRARRYSMVFYAKSAMKKCAPVADEWRRAAREATR